MESTRTGSKGGRPRRDLRQGFHHRFATVLPQLLAGEISQSQAARRLGISIRSLKRYKQRWLAASRGETGAVETDASDACDR